MWVIYYDDFSRVEGPDPYEVPRLGVQYIVVPSRAGYSLVFGSDYYVYDPEVTGWRGTDIFGLWDYLTRCKRPVVLFGREMPDDRFRALLKQIREDCGPREAWTNV